jgi:hypothetical protein
MIMRTKKALVSVLLAAGTIVATAIPLPGLAAANIDLSFGPPPPRYEVVPPPRSGFVWAPGYWSWDGHRHVWHHGHWVRARPGHVYRAPYWVEHNGHWTYRESRWDRDGDGIPNHRDPTPNGGRFADRDRDGVPDRYDAHPRDPYRH